MTSNSQGARPTASISAARLAATEYILFRDPERTVETEFGSFTMNPDFPFRHDANQLFDPICPPGRERDLLEHLDELYLSGREPDDAAQEPLSPMTLHVGGPHPSRQSTFYEVMPRPFRKITLHDDETLYRLRPAFAEQSRSTAGGEWSVHQCWMMLWTRAPERPSNPDVSIEAVPFDDPTGELEAIALANDGHLDSFRYHQLHDPRLGGEAIVARVNGQAVGKSGWFIVDGVARFRGIDTIEPYRRRGVASSMIRYVQERPEVRAADGLAIFCDDDGPIPLYESLGFEKQARLWSCLRKLPSYSDEYGAWQASLRRSRTSARP